MLVGIVIALELVLPTLGMGLPILAFGRLRPLHTNAAIFAFAGNAVFAAVYHSTQRLCKARIFSDFLSWFHFWGWQLIIVAAAITLPLGYTQSKEYAELEWPIDLTIAVVWVAFAVNFFGTLARRRERHMYVALWFYIATVVAHHRPARLQQPGAAGRPVEELSGLRRRAGRLHGVVVRAQRGGLLSHHAVSGHDVLLPAQGGRAAGLFLPSEHRALLVAGLHLHLGGPAPPALHGLAGMGLDAGNALLGDALDAVLGRHDQRPAHAPRGLEQSGRRPDPEVLRGGHYLLRHVDLRGPDALGQGGQRPGRTIPTGSSPTCTAARWAGWAS